MRLRELVVFLIVGFKALLVFPAVALGNFGDARSATNFERTTPEIRPTTTSLVTNSFSAMSWLDIKYPSILNVANQLKHIDYVIWVSSRYAPFSRDLIELQERFSEISKAYIESEERHLSFSEQDQGDVVRLLNDCISHFELVQAELERDSFSSKNNDDTNEEDVQQEQNARTQYAQMQIESAEYFRSLKQKLREL